MTAASPPAPRDCVFDCNILFQAVISATGPSAACVAAAREGRIRLFVSQYVLDELLDLCLRPKLQNQFGITPAVGAAFVRSLVTFAVSVAGVPDVYAHPFDPDDSHYVNLALATNAELIVSRDRQLQNLMDATRPEGADFVARFPQLRIIAPDVLLSEI
jgi:putative PIN family toxin of toxin-antitoxin system